MVIDDLGESREQGLRAIALPTPLTVAILPYATHSDEIARRAVAAGKDVIVHVPMQPMHGQILGHGGLTMQLDRGQFLARVNAALDAVPFARGANNHMGSLLTARRDRMDWLMSAIASRRGWLFLDSRTTKHTVAAIAAVDAGVPAISRDVFLDNYRDSDAVQRALERAVTLARRRGFAVAIGHPHPHTLAVLERVLPTLPARGVRPVSLTRIAQRQRLRVRYDSSDGQAPTIRYSPSAPSTQLATGTPAIIAGW